LPTAIDVVDPRSTRRGILSAALERRRRRWVDAPARRGMVGVVSARGPADRLGDVIAGRFRLERLLGAGGMGEVYVAIQEPLGRRVALKLIKAGLADDKGAAGRFEREAQSLAALHHPHIVTIFDFGRTAEGELFMAMEFLPGVSLRERLRGRGALPIPEALRVVDDICAALEAAHRAGIVHRDLKPDNIMLVDLVQSGGPKDFVKVLDFGIARLRHVEEQRHLTHTGHIVGTPGYIAPEMVTAGVLDDPRSDLYAVGVILFELLTGRTLFDAPTPVMLLMKHAQEPPPRLVKALTGRSIHPEIDALVQRLLEKRPEDRYASAADVRVAIASLPDAALMPFTDPLVGAQTMVRSTPPPSTPPPSTPPPSTAAPSTPQARAPLHDSLPHDALTMDTSRPRVRGDTAPTMSRPVDAAPPPARGVPLPVVIALIVAVVAVAALVLITQREPPPAPPPPVVAPPAPTPTIVAPPAPTPPPPEPTPPPAPPPTVSPPTRPVKRPPPPPPAPPPHRHVPDLTP